MNIDVSTVLATLQLDPDDTQALEALAGLQPGNGAGVDPEALGTALGDARRFHRERGDFALVLQLIDLELGWTKDAARRADLLHEKGRLLSDELLRGEAGFEGVQAALASFPGHGPSKESLAQMSLLRGNWLPISKRYLQQAQAAETAGTDLAHAASLYAAVAELYLKYGGADVAAEGEGHLRKSLALDPKSRRPSAHLERLLREGSRWNELLALYAARADVATSREERALAEVLAGEVSAKVGGAGNPDEALAHFRKALEASPFETRALRPVRDALMQRQEWAELVKVLETAARTKRGEQDVALQVDLALLLWKRLDDGEAAEVLFRRVRKLDPANHDMVDFYRAYYGAKGDPARLLQIIAQAQKSEGDVDRRVAMGIEMARATEARPQSADKAIDLWKGLLRLKPRLPEAIESLKTLYTRTEKWNALLEILKDEIDALPAGAVDEKVNRYLEIVTIYRDHLNLDVMVVNTYLSILALRPDHPDALTALAARYEAQGRWNDLIQVLGKQAEASSAASDGPARVALHRRIAGLWADKLGKHGNAVASLEKILEADPADAETSARLKDLYTKSRAWRPLLDVYRRELPHLAPDSRRPRLAEMARVAGERLNDVRDALNLWNQVLAIAPRDPDALAGLATLYERERRWPALVEILERQRQNAEGNPTAELALLERSGMLLYERLGATEGAIEVFRRIQQLQPQNARAARALREIYAQSGDFAALEAMYVEQGAFSDLCDQLTSLADRTADMGARTRLLERVAALAVEKLNQPERALKAYERILTTEPQNRRAALALVPLYRQAQKWPRLLATYESLLGPAAGEGGTLAERLELLAEARLICEQRLGSKGLAFQWAARAFEVAPKNDAVRADLERVAGEADEHGPLATLYAKRADATTDAEERLWLLRRALRIALTRLYRPLEARVFAERIVAELGHDDEADAALEQIFTQTKAWPELAALLHARADRAPDIAERVRQLFRVAQLEEERVGDAAAAGRTMEAIVEAEPANERALKALARVAEARQDWAGLVEALRRDLAARGQRETKDGASREDVLLRIGQIQETRLGDVDGTFASYREVVQANPQSASAVAGLERLVAGGRVPEARAEIATLTLPFYERAGDAAKLAGAHEALLAVADTRGEKVERLERLRGLYGGPLADAAGATRAALALFELDPADAENRAQLVTFAVAADRTAELVDKARALATATDDTGLRRDLLVTIAELQEQKLGRAGDAEQTYAEILAVEPLNAGAFKALQRLFREGERWADLRGLLDARQGASLEPRERLDLLAQIAELDEVALDDAPHAIATYEKMLELDTADMRAHRALDRHYAAAERWRDLEELLGTRISFATPAEVPELEFRRADLRSSRLGDVEGALDLLEEIVRKASSHEGARRLLEKLLASPDHRQRVARVLEPLYEAGAAWARLVAVLEVRREALPPAGAETATLLARIADLQENKLQARANALATWREALTADPDNPDALVEIERIATTLERFSELVDVYQELAFKREASDISGRADLLARAAKLHAGRLGNRRAATEAWKLVLNLDVDNLATARPAAAALEQLYTETNDVAALVKILRVEAGWAEGVAERKALLFRVADLEQKSLGDGPAAVTTLRAILEIDPQDQTAIAGLEQIFEAGAQHAQRVEMLRKRIDLAQDPAARQELWRRVAGLLERDVGDVEEAIAACVAILDENPEDATALETLSRLYEQQGRHRDRLEILERRLALLGASAASSSIPSSIPSARAELLRQLAALLEGPLGDRANALERWREVLAAAPGDAGALQALERFLAPSVDAPLRLAAAQALEPVYENAGRFAELAGLVQVYIDSEGDGRARLEQLMRLASLQETRLGDPEAALRTTALALRGALAEPELPSLLDAYERLAGAGRVAEVAALYRELSPDVLDEDAKLRLERFIADAAGTLGDLPLAIDYHRRVLDRLPEDERALAALDRIYRETNAVEPLVEILARRADLARDVTHDATAEQRFRLQLGQLAESPLARLDDAIGAYERVLELAPESGSSRDAREALDRLYTQSERWADLARFLGEALTRGRLPERDVVGIRFRLAQIEHDRQLDREAALEHLRFVLQGDPDHPGAITMLEGMLDDIAVQGQAAELLEPVYAAKGDWKLLIKIGEIRLLQVEDPAERVAWTKRIARLYEEQLEDFDSALRWYGKVFQEAPTERLSVEPLLRLAGKLDRWRDVGTLFGSYVADELSDDPAVLEVVRRTAEIFDLRLGDHDEARKHYRRLFDALPDDRAVAQLYEGALERWEAWLELRELIDEQAGRTIDGVAKLTFLRRSAKLDEERLGNRSRAIGTLQEASELDPTEGTTADEIERLLRAEELWHDLSDHLVVVLSRVTDPAERETVTLRLADVLETKVGDVGAAIDRYGEVLARTPGRREAVAALERIAADPDHRHRVAVVLEPVYRGTGDWGKLVGALEAQLETVEDRDARVAILREMADIYQRLARLDLAFDCRARAWLVDVSSAETLGEMETLAVSARQYAPLVATLGKGALEANDPDLQAQLWGIAARLSEQHLGDAPQAIEAWRAALGSRPDDEEAFHALERLLSHAARPAELVEVLERHAEMTLDAADKKAITKRVAVLYDDALKQPEQALRAWEAVLDIDANDVEALDALAQLHLAGSSYRELAEIFERKLALVEIPSHRRALRLDVAQLYDEKLDDADQAVTQLRAVLDEAPQGGDPDALSALDAIFSRDERHADLLEVLDTRIAIAPNATARDGLALRAARLTEVELSDVEGAIGRYQQILSGAPDNAGARAALWAIARGTDYRSPAIAALMPVLRAAHDWAGVVELLELHIAGADAVDERVAALGEIARIEEVERRNTHKAFEAWARALTEDPTAVTTATSPRANLERLAAATGDFAGLARVYAERMDATFDASLQRELALRLAQLFETRLGDLGRAADYLRQALSLPGDEAEVLASLERVLRAQDGAGVSSELAEVLGRQAEVSNDAATQAEFLAALGEVRFRALDDAEGALGAYRDALERDPGHAGARAALHELLDRPEVRESALEVLEPLAEARGDHDELLALYEYRVGLRDDPAERAHWLRKIAELCDTQLGDARRALDALGRALKEEPQPGGALDDLERIAGGSKLAREGAALIESVLDAAEPEAARELALRAGRLYEAPPADLAGAERLYARVLEGDAENVDALTALEALYRGAGPAGAPHLAGILERRAGVELDPQARKRRFGEAARLYEQQGDVPGAIAAWQKLRAAEEGDAEALTELARLYEATGQGAALLGALAERARWVEQPAERAALWARVGGLRLAQDDVDGAAEAYREALEGAPEDAAVLGALEMIEGRREDWATLQEILQRQLGVAAGPAQVAVLFKLAKNAETRLSDLEQASGYLRQVLDVEPANATAYVELERQLRAGERWYDLVDVLGKHADVEGAAGRKPNELALRVAVADVWERELSSPDSAVEALEKVLEVAPTNVAALLSMARIHEGAERWDEAGAALERAAAAATSGPEAAEINYRSAQILRAKDAPAADVEALLLRGLDAAPNHVPTLEALEGIARDAGDAERLVQLLELRYGATEGDAKPDLQRKLLSEIAALYKKLGRGGQAVPILERLVALAPDEIGGREDLADALIAAGRTADAVAIARDLIEQLTKARRGKEAARWYQRLGAIGIADGDLAAATEHFNAAYKLDPAHPLTLSALGRLAFERGDLETARKFYRSLLLQSFDEAGTGVSKAEVYLMLGRMHVIAKEIPKARNMFERGLETDPKSEPLKQALAALPK